MKVKYSFPFFLFLFVFIQVSCKKQSSLKNENIHKGNEKVVPVYIGTYTRNEGFVDGKAEGIYKVEFNLESGKLSNTTLVAKVINPSFLKTTANRDYLYTVSELAREGEKTGYVEAFHIDDDRKLTSLGKIETGGKAPCHVELDKEEKYIITTNYMDGVVHLFAIKDEGHLALADRIHLEGSSIHPRQKGPHAHSASISPDNQLAYIADLGSDKIWVFRIDHKNEKLIPYTSPYISITPGGGPRHLDMTNDGRYLFVVNELNSTIELIEHVSEQKSFNIVQKISTLPQNFIGDNTSADIHLHPNQKYIYASNRGHNSIVAFTFNKNQEKLTFIGHYPSGGKTPRNFNLSPDGSYLLTANQDSDNMLVYKINEEDGTLTDIGVDYKVMTPVCVEF